MTDKQKVAHACAVLAELADRERECRVAEYLKKGKQLQPKADGIEKNLRDLIEVLKTPHKAEPKKVKELHPKAEPLAVQLYKRIEFVKPNFKKPDISKWAIEMDKILRLDKRQPNAVLELINWATQDKFWSTNILSPAALRRNLDRLELQMEKDWNWQHNKLQRRKVDGPTLREQYIESLGLEDSDAKD
jgi:hypothetical protein